MHTDYQRIARAIHYLVRNREQQPTLDELAAELNLSPFHCQRLFQRWAGISPKRFLQYLTVKHAKCLLAESRSVLDASLASGLSGSSRLHEHFVTLNAITPGEFKQGGVGLTIRYGIHDSPFGPLFLAITERGICRLGFLADQSLEDELQGLVEVWPVAVLQADQQATGEVVARLFERPVEPGRPLHLLVRGSNFQISVWQALLQLPPGVLCSYGDLAHTLGRPRAARAIGQAVGANPIAWLIPCHRVIRANGVVDGYRWGTTRKRAMIAWESAHKTADEPSAVSGTAVRGV